ERNSKTRKPEKIKRPFLPFHSSGFLASKFILLVRHEGDDDRGDKHVGERDPEKKPPAEPHQLIIAETGQGPAHPDEEDQQSADLGEEDEDVEEAAKNSRPAA